MANQVFAEATTSTAFLLTLTKRQCNTLLRLHAHEAKHGKPSRTTEGARDGSCDRDSPGYIGIVQVDQLHPLLARGLVSWFRAADGRACGFAGLTRAGELAADMLGEAGLTIESTNTLSVLKRMDRMAA